MTVGLSMHVDSAIAHLRQRVSVHDAQVSHKAQKDGRHKVVIELIVSPFSENPDTLDLEKAEDES